MALPRYKTSIPYQPSTVVGLQESARTFGSLADRLEQFANIGYEIGKEDATERGYQKALTDMTSGEPLKVEEGYGFYAKAYNKTAQTAYNSQVEADLKAKAEELSIGAKTKDEFDTVFSQYSKTMANKIEQPEFKAIFQQNAIKVGSSYSSKLVTKLYERDRKNQIDAISLGLEDDKISYANAIANNDQASATDSIAKATARMESLVQLGDMSKEAIPYKLKDFQRSARVISTQTGFINAEAQGSADAYIKDFLKRSDIEPKERLEALKFFKNYTNEKHDAMYADIKNDNELVKVSQDISYRKISSQILLGQDVKDSTLDAMLGDRTVSDEQYLKLKQMKANINAGANVDDENEVNRILININTEAKEDIANNNKLSAKTKQVLLKRKDDLSLLEIQNKEMASKFTAVKQATGKDPWGLVNEKVSKKMKDGFIPNEYQKDRLDIIEGIRADVASGVVNVLDVADEADKRIGLWEKSIADKKEAKKKEASKKKYDEEMLKYNEKKASTWGKFKGALGFEIEQPKMEQ